MSMSNTKTSTYTNTTNICGRLSPFCKVLAPAYLYKYQYQYQY